jgi:hypothetical protein
VSSRSLSPNLLLGAAISALGLCLHNVADLPNQYPWSPETAYPTVVLLALLAVCLINRRLGCWLLVAWAGLNLVGGGLFSVLPLPFLPYEPEQSVRHYAWHVVYGLTQLPLLVAAWHGTRRGPESQAPTGSHASTRD